MHCLEHLLLMLSKRIESETGSKDLAAAAHFLASESHKYNTDDGTEDETIRDMNAEWREEYPLH